MQYKTSIHDKLISLPLNMAPKPRLQIDASSSQSQPLREDLVSILRDACPEKSYEEINNIVSAWNRPDDGVTLCQTTTTTTTNEVVVPKPLPVKPCIPTMEQFAVSIAALHQPVVQHTTLLLIAHIEEPSWL